MMKILKSISLVIAVAAVAGGATYAYFTDQATVSNNTFAAGKLDFTLNGDMTESKRVQLGNMLPGDWYGPYKMTIYNKNAPDSTIAMKYRFQDKKDSESVAGFYDKLNVKVEHGNCADGGEISWLAYTNTGKLSDLNFESSSAISSSLDPNISHCFKLYFQLDPSAGNSLQGGSAVADIVVDGTQTSNPGWTE